MIAKPVLGIVAAASLTMLLVAAGPRRGDALEVRADPRVTLWSWAGPEDLSCVDPKAVAVAFLAGTVVAEGDSVKALPRLRELRIAAGTRLTAVVRLETGSGRSHGTSPAQRALMVQQILKLTDRPDVREVQVDFDARLSERALYRELLTDLRRSLRPDMHLSMTALASWCLGDPWISGMPVDRAVPMLFRMGDDDGRVRSHVASGGAFGPALCRGDVGVSTDEPFPPIPSRARIWVFHPRPWDAAALRETLGTTACR